MSVTPSPAQIVIPAVRILATAASAAQDLGRVRLGAGMKTLPAATPSRVADHGRVRLGAGMRRF